MKIIDRFISGQYLFNFFLLLAVLFTIIVLIDFSLNFDEYADAASRASKAATQQEVLPVSTQGEGGGSGGSGGRALPEFLRMPAATAHVVWDLWWPRFFQLTGFLIGVVMVGAMGFTCSQLVKNREFIAVLASGVSLHRMALPIVITSVGLCLLQVVNREMIVPHLAPLLTREKKQAGTQSLGVTSQPLCSDSLGRLFYAQSVNLDTDTITGLYIWERDSNGLMTSRITAESAKYQDGAWVLTNGQIQTRESTSLQSQFPPPKSLDKFITDLDPTVLKLRRFEGYSYNLSTSQLSELIARYQSLPEAPISRIEALERIKFGRYSMVTVNLLAVVLCLPFFLRREPCNMVVQSLYASPIALCAISSGLIGATTAVPALPPLVSVFVPVLVMIPLCVAAVTSVRT